MVKLNYGLRIKELETIIRNAKRVNKSVPRLEQQLKILKQRKQKGNKNLFQF